VFYKCKFETVGNHFINFSAQRRGRCRVEEVDISASLSGITSIKFNFLEMTAKKIHLHALALKKMFIPIS